MKTCPDCNGEFPDLVLQTTLTDGIERCMECRPAAIQKAINAAKGRIEEAEAKRDGALAHRIFVAVKNYDRLKKIEDLAKKLLTMGEFFASAIEADLDFRENYDFEEWKQDLEALI